MTDLTIRPHNLNIFGAGRSWRRSAKEATIPPTKKVFFMGRSYNEAIEFLNEVDINVSAKWECIHNLASCQGLTAGRIYICPGAEEKPDFKDIVDTLHKQGKFHFIIMQEVKTWEIQ